MPISGIFKDIAHLKLPASKNSSATPTVPVLNQVPDVSLLGTSRSLAMPAGLSSPCPMHAWQDSQAQFLHLYRPRNCIPEACGRHM